MDMLIYLGLAWWTFAVVGIMIVATQSDIDDYYTLGLAVAMCVFWPLTAVLFLPAMLYQGAVASAARIRADLFNRKLLREFESWLANKDNEKSP
jgi:hypothetical protein